MRAIVLAAGKGERLKGVIDDVPKPMVRLQGRPILEHNIGWLERQGIRDIYINLHHMGDTIQSHFGNGDRFGISIRYSCEAELLGTAGAVRKIADTLWPGDSSPFLVVYGDNLFGCDLGEVIDFHRAKGGMGAIALYEIEDVSGSGIVLLDGDGRVERFIEKPRPEETVSRLVNTGLYVLEPAVIGYIPEGRPSDFGRDVFPAVLAAGEALFGVGIKGTLTPIDTPLLFRRALSGRDS